MNWLQSIYEVVGVPYPRLSLALAAVFGAILFSGGWWLVGREYAKEHSTASTQVLPNAPSRPPLLPQQRQLLGLLVGYQRPFGVSKLVVTRHDGRLHFDEAPDRGEDISIVRDLYGSVDAQNAARFEELMESMPPEYVRLIPEARWDSPFVLKVTPAGMQELTTQQR